MRSMPKVPPKGFTFGLLLHKHIHSSVGRKKVPMGWEEEKAWKAPHRKRGATGLEIAHPLLNRHMIPGEIGEVAFKSKDALLLAEG